MPPANPALKLKTAPLNDLVVVLLKQFQRLIQDRGTQLSLAKMQAIGDATATHSDYPADVDDIRQHLRALVGDSLTYLQERFGWTYAESLAHDMTTITDWETTSDFLEIANHKSNAELRISAGATILVMLGDATYAPYLLDVIDADGGSFDVDAVFAMRALAHLDNSHLDAPDWLAQQRAKYASSD